MKVSAQPSAERKKRGTITKAEGDRNAAMNLAAAARTMAASPGAMQLRTLQTINGLGPTASNPVVLAVPVDILQTIRALGDSLGIAAKPETPVLESGDQRKQIPAPAVNEREPA